jgi:hypothetical protein
LDKLVIRSTGFGGITTLRVFSVDPERGGFAFVSSGTGVALQFNNGSGVQTIATFPNAPANLSSSFNSWAILG